MSNATNRFIHENKDMAQWLLQLVGENPIERRLAGHVITNRFFMPMDLIMEQKETAESIQEQFRTEVRNTLRKPDFPASAFVRQLLSLDMALQEAWCRKVEDDFAQSEELDKAELAKLGENPTEEQTKRYVCRLWVRFLRDCKQISKEEPHEAIVTGSAVTYVIEALGKELLPAASLIRLMLKNRNKAYVASEAIARMGREGYVFYADLLKGLQSEDSNFNCSRALGAVLRHVPEKIPEILELACGEDVKLRIGALTALGSCGRVATASLPEVESHLRAQLQKCGDEREWHTLVSTLGEVGESSETVSLLLGAIDLKNPHRTGSLIMALGRMGRDAERVVPRLIEMLDAFEEYDPDYSYHGEHERVVGALRSFGLTAASAVPALARHVWTKPQQYYDESGKLEERKEPDEKVIKFLGELGPLAAEALPALLDVKEVLRARVLEERTKVENDADNITEDMEETYVDVAIKKISQSAKKNS
jgi:hypothetical protein